MADGADLDSAFNLISRELVSSYGNFGNIGQIKTYNELLEENKIEPVKSIFSKGQKKVGFWRYDAFDPSVQEYPFPMENSSKLTGEEKRDMLRKYDRVVSLSKSVGYMGFSLCRICDCHNGSEEYTYKCGDKEFIFPEGYKHYLDVHNVQIDEDFYEELKKL